MDSEAMVDKGKRRFLIGATGVVGGVGAVAATAPFVMSLFPSERAKAAGAPVEIDIGKIEPGQKIDVEWRGKVCWIVSRTPEMLATLPRLADRLADPKSGQDQQPAYCKNEHRSIKPQLWVAVGICTHLGCSPTAVPAGSNNPSVPADWQGGYFCPCHGSTFDGAGRVFKNKPAPTNLEIPPHQYLSDSRLLIGEDSRSA